MASPNELAISLKIVGDTSDIQAEISKVVGGMGSIGSAATKNFNEATQGAHAFRSEMRDLVGQYSAFWLALRAARDIGKGAFIGLDFLAQMESAKLSIGALITAEATLTNEHGKQLSATESLSAGMAMADVQIQKLRVSGLQTAATTEQLVGAYQSAVGSGLRANMSLDQIRILTIQVVQAAGAMNVPMQNLNQEIRSILDGNITRNSKVAKRLGITSADVAKWRQAGTLFTELNTRMQAFSEAGTLAMGTWKVMVNNLEEASQILLGEVFKQPFGNIKETMAQILNMVLDFKNAGISPAMANIVQMGKDIAGMLTGAILTGIRTLVAGIKSLADWWAIHRLAVLDTMQVLSELAGGALKAVALVLGTTVKWVTEFALWLGSTNPIVRVFITAIAGVAAAMWTLNAAQTTAATGMGRWIAQIISGGIPALLRQIPLMWAMSASIVTANGQLVFQTGLLGLASQAWTFMGMAGSRAMALIGGPLVAIPALVGLVVYGLKKWNDSYSALAADHAEAFQQQEEKARDAATEIGAVADSLDKANKQAANAKLGAEAHAAATEALKNEVQQLSEKYPGLIDYLKQEGDHYKDLHGSMQQYLHDQIAIRQSEFDTAIAAAQATAAEIDNVNAMGYWAQLRAGWTQEAIANLEREQGAQTAAAHAALDAIKALQAAQSITLHPNKAEPTKAEENAKLERANQLRQVADMMEKDKLEMMEKESLLDQRNYEQQKAINEALHQGNEIRDKKMLTAQEKANAIAMIQADLSVKLTNINRTYDEKELSENTAFWEKWGIAGENTLERRLDTVRKNLAAEVEAHRKATGEIISDAQQKAQLAERIEAETARFTEQEMQKLQTKMKKFAKDGNISMSLQEQIEWLQKTTNTMGYTSKAVEDLTKKLKQQQAEERDWAAGWRAGLHEFVVNGTNAFTNFKNMAVSMMKKVQSTLATVITDMITKHMTLKNAMKQIWTAISQEIVSALANIAAQYITTAIAQAILGKQQQTTAGATAAAAQISAGAQMFEADSGIPIVGPIIAASGVALMAATLAANATSASAQASAVPQHAAGGLFNRPTLGIFGEAGPELIAPERNFMDWAASVHDDSVKAGAERMQQKSAEPSFQAASGPQSPSGDIHVHIHGHIMGTDARSKATVGKWIQESLVTAQQRSSHYIKPGMYRS